MNNNVRLVIAQINFVVGDISGNTDKVIAAIEQAQESHQAEVIIFPELALTGYPPEDLLFRPSLRVRVDKALERLKSVVKDIYVIVGYPKGEQEHLYNVAGVVYGGEVIAEYKKQILPNYQVFDEKRYFEAGDSATVFDLNGIPTALTICEDIWHEGPMSQAKAAGAQLMLNLNASPYHLNKEQERLALLKERAVEGGMPIVYANMVGGQDELVFDGGSMVVDQRGDLIFSAPTFEEKSYFLELSVSEKNVPTSIVPPRSLLASVYEALVLGVKDYINKNGFKGAVLGLSGGIDSALTLAVAVDALGKDRVQAVMMPFKYTSQMSLDDAAEEAETLGVVYKIKPIESIYNAFMSSLEEDFKGTEVDTTEENLQARCRGILLMALSNKMGSMVLTTGNKSEMAVGYATLYGDMAGGYDVLKDVPKTMVFKLCEYRNRDYADLNKLNSNNSGCSGNIIPQRVIDRPPSAELAPDQKDSDSLPPYDELDQILEWYVENDLSADAIINKGFDADVVKRVIRLVDLNEYKRRQAPVGVRITPRGFGKDRRYPITCRWPAGD